MHEPQAAFTCAFASASSCTHDQLFQAQYQRTNRLNHTKILRCFPHCCPTHVARSYCGSSVWLQVTQPIRPFAPPPPRLRVFAHFRTEAEANRIKTGSLIPVPRDGVSLQSEKRTNADWVDSRLASKSCSKTHHEWLFEINPNHRWYYAWQSGKQISRRMTSHVLEALVVVDTGHSVVQVVGSTTSTPFTIISFRRSLGSNKAAPDRSMTALEASLYERFLESSPPESSYAPELTLAPVKPLNPDGSLFASELGALFASVSHIRLHQVYELVPEWSEFKTANDELLLTSSSHGVLVNFVWALCIDKEIQDAFTWHATQASKVLMDIRAIDACFHQWEDWLRAAIARRLIKHRLVWSELVATADAVINASSSERQEQRWSHVFERGRFLAQVRQICVDQVKSQRPHRTVALVASVRSAASINGVWRCLLENIRLLPIDDNQTMAEQTPRLADLSVASAIAFWQQWSWLHVECDPVARTLALGSASHSHVPSSLPCRLILDGRFRSFDCLPHGEPAMAAGSVLGGQCFGDYVGVIVGSNHIEVTLFSWPEDSWLRLSTGSHLAQALRWSWILPLDADDVEGLQLRIRVSTAAIPVVLDEALETQSIQDRLALVCRWHDVHTMECVYHRSRSV